MSRSTTLQLELFKRSPERWQPHKYQKLGVKWLLEHACAALFADPGVGKTSITLGALSLLIKGGHASKVLIIAPRRVCYEVWPDEVKKWADFNHLRVEVLHGPDKEEALHREADIYCVNPEGLEWLLGSRGASQVNLKRWKALGFDTLVVDELSKFKHSNTKRFKQLKQVLGTFRRRWGLTGSPAANGLMGLFGQAYVLDMGNALGAYVTHYRNRFFVPSFDGFSWVPQENAEAKIYAALAPLVMRIGSEHLDLPTLVDKTVDVSLDDKVRKVYMELEEHLITELEAGTITAANAAVASSKCRQVASGGIYLDEGSLPPIKSKTVHRVNGRTWASLHDAKVDALEELIEELQGKPLLVGYDFQHDLAHCQQRFGDVPFIGGGVSDARVAELKILWNQGKLPLLFGHPQSMGHGLNLQSACSHVCWFSLTWDYELYDQFIKRVHRQGNKADRVFVYHLMARGTVDEAIYWALKSKKKGQQALFDGINLLKKRRSA